MGYIKDLKLKETDLESCKEKMKELEDELALKERQETALNGDIKQLGVKLNILAEKLSLQEKLELDSNEKMSELIADKEESDAKLCESSKTIENLEEALEKERQTYLKDLR